MNNRVHNPERVRVTYGYCDVIEPAAGAPWKAKDQPTAAKRKQRRYGWVPALAVQ